MKATKKQMVDFIDGRCRFDEGKRIPKSKLSKCPKESLMEVIHSDPAIIRAFEEYVKEDNAKREIVTLTMNTKTVGESLSSQKKAERSAMVSEEKTQELQELVDELIKEPTSFVAMMKLKQFMDNLPYGSVENDTLDKMIEQIQAVSPSVAYVLLNYSVNQVLYFQ